MSAAAGVRRSSFFSNPSGYGRGAAPTERCSTVSGEQEVNRRAEVGYQAIWPGGA